MTTWAEDRAPVGTDPSADPGGVSEVRAAALGAAHLSRLQHQGEKSQGVWGTGPPVPPATTILPKTNPTPDLPFHGEPGHCHCRRGRRIDYADIDRVRE